MAEQNMRELVAKYALKKYSSGQSCAEAVFDALLEAGVISAPEGAIRLLSGFGGGIGLSGYTCGALSGAVMAVGTKHSRDPGKSDPKTLGSELYNGYYRLYNNMAHRFSEENGGALCREITAGHSDWHGSERRGACGEVVARAVKMAYDCLKLSKEEACSMPYGENPAGAK